MQDLARNHEQRFPVMLPAFGKSALGIDRLVRWHFDVPFPPPAPACSHPHHMQLKQSIRTFLAEHGVLVTARDEARYERHDLAMWTVFCYPGAPVEGQRLIGDFIALAAEWDHTLGQPANRGRAAEPIAPLRAAIQGCPGGAESPYRPAWQDIWARWCDGMPAKWVTLTSDHCIKIFTGLIEEDLAEGGQTMLTAEVKSCLRDETGLGPVLFDLIERAGRFSLPTPIRDLPQMREMLFHANREIWMTNEIQSLPKELAGGESNLVLILEAKGATRRDALGALRVPVEERVDAYRFIAGMRTIMSGSVAWCGSSGRYQQYALDRA